ncbi:MAG: AAA family ATPase [Actinomycetota bacterium]|nr:AAA family ATPase [Actinomycetota bacterium]
MAARPEIDEEQAFLDEAYRGLDAMRRDADEMLHSVLDLGRGGTFQSRTERDIVVRTSLARLAQLDIGDQALCFGRIDRRVAEDRVAEDRDAGARDAGADGEIESFHIGRLAVSGESHEPLVVDWRAPVAEPFYRATGLDPQGLVRRRHLAVRHRTVVGVEDEHFADPASAQASATDPGVADSGSAQAGAVDGLAFGGPGALLAAIGQVRTGRMGDIVATIQREQDEIIRSPLGGLLMVQGGPGTGKTAVALHRAAYLLYTHRFPLEMQGVLVVGPNPLFLRYIEQVLPSLGETGVTLSTVAGLVPGLRVRGTDDAETARLKGDIRMVRVIARAVRSRERALRRDVAVPYGGTTLLLTAGASADVVARARRRSGTHNARRRFVEQQVARILAGQYRRYRTSHRTGPALTGPEELDAGRVEGGSGGDPAGTSGEELDLDAFGREVRRHPALAEALDRMWPRLAPHELLHDLFGASALIAAAGRGVLTDREQAQLSRPRSRSFEEIPWTEADAALVDEAGALLGPRRRPPHRARRERRRGVASAWDDTSGVAIELGADPGAALRSGPRSRSSAPSVTESGPVRAYGHIVVDEVQDLSALQLRMLARRSLAGSMTVVGDIAQATGPWAPRDWSSVAQHLAPGTASRLVELTVSYRTPAEVVDVAAGVLAVSAPGLSPPVPVRRSGYRPVLVHTRPDMLARRVADQVSEELAAVAPGRTAVLVPPELRGSVVDALTSRGLDPVDPREPSGRGLDAPLVVLDAGEANGLEFDSVVVVEPALLVQRGWSKGRDGSAGRDGSEGRDGSGGDGPPVATRRGLRTLYVALTRPTQRLAVVSSRPLPAGLVLEPPASSPVTRMLASEGERRLGNTP